MSILTLPCDCIQLIFDRIPTHHLLLHTRRVCHDWQHNQQLNCRRRKSLIILYGKLSFKKFTNHIFNKAFIGHNIDQNGNWANNKSFISKNRISISPNRNPKVIYLVSIFPNLQTLIVSTDSVLSHHLQSFYRLITHYSSKLVTLQLYLEGEIQNRAQNASVSKIMSNLMNQLNSFTSLRHLTCYDHYGSISPQIEEPVFLTRIKEFYFDFGGLEKFMLYSVRKYDLAGRLGQLTRLYLTTFSIDEEMPSINQIDRVPLAGLYIFIPCDKYLYNEQHLMRIVAKFHSITTFKYILSAKSITSLTKLTSILSPLTKLVHIHLGIEFAPTNNKTNQPTAPLRSLKALSIHFDKSLYSLQLLPIYCQTQVDSIVQCFPHLQSIRIITDDYIFYINGQSPWEKIAQKFLDRLKEAYGRPSLCTQYYNENIARKNL